MMENKLVVSMSPHICGSEGTKGIMLDVIIALMPAALAGIHFFGYRAALVMLTAIISCFVFIFNIFLHILQKNSTSDFCHFLWG